MAGFFRQFARKITGMLGGSSDSDDVPHDAEVTAFRLLQEAQVQTELKLNVAQADQIATITRTTRQKYRDQVRSLQGLPAEARREQGPPLRRAIAEEALR